MSTKVSTFPTARIPMAEQDVAEVAAAGIHAYIADFVSAVNVVDTSAKALIIGRLIDALMVELGTAQMIALDRADRLCS